MASPASSSSSSSALPKKEIKKEPKLEIKQEPQPGILLPKLEPKDVKIETMEVKEVKREPTETPIDTKDPVEEQLEKLIIDNNKLQLEKMKRYEADFKQHLMSKYFSGKTLFGGEIYDVKQGINGETIRASRLPPQQSYLDPATFHELLDKASESEDKASESEEPISDVESS